MAVSYDPTAQVAYETQDVEVRRIGEAPMLATVYQPEGAGPFPVILHVHGGQWSDIGNRTRGDAAVARGLAASGMVVAAIDLRVTPHHHYPASAQDVNFGVRWLKAHAADFKGDPSTIGAFGGSSGGHLVLLHAMRHQDPRYLEPDLAVGDDATVGYLLTRAPISDPLARLEWAVIKGRHDIDEHTHAYFQPWETVTDANPQRILERGEASSLPPLMILQGGEDENIDPAIQRKFADTYRAAGGEVEYHEFEGEPHQFLNNPGPAAERAMGLARGFIARQLGRVLSA